MKLIMLINIDTLEFDGFYSTLQDRFIPLIQDEDKRFLDSYNLTIKNEIIYYLNLLEEREKYYQEQANKKGLNTIIKKKSLKKVE